MFDIQKLIAIVTDALDDNAEMIRHNIQIRANMGLPKDALLWVPTMKGDVAYRTGELTERSSQNWRKICDICHFEDVDPERLISAVKSMQRWEKHNGRWDRKAWPTSILTLSDERRLVKYLKKNND